MWVTVKRKIQNYNAGDIVEATVIGGNFLRIKGDSVVLHPKQWELALDDDILDEILKDWEYSYGSK